MSVPAQVLLGTQRLLNGKLLRPGTQRRARIEANQRALADSIIQFHAA